MISSVSFHPFISHFSPALFVAGLALLFLAHKKNDEKLKAAGAFNLSLGLLAAVVADFSGMVSVDINLRTVVDVEGHPSMDSLPATPTPTPSRELRQDIIWQDF